MVVEKTNERYIVTAIKQILLAFNDCKDPREKYCSFFLFSFLINEAKHL